MPKSQREEVIQYIRKHGFIDRVRAASLYIFELSARIGELEKRGYCFDRKRRTGKNRHGRKYTVVEYRIDEEATRRGIAKRISLTDEDRAFPDSMAVMP